MTFKECIVKAAEYLGLNKLAASIDDGDITEAQPFFEMAKDIVQEICTDYYPLRVAETVVTDNDGVIMLSELSKTPLDVFGVKKDGAGRPFSLRYNRIETGGKGTYEVEYSYMPTLSGLTSRLPFGEKISGRIVAYGIAAEYCIINGLDDAVLWDKRYRDALHKALIQKSEKRVKKRVWL